ncbi:MAG: 3D domain-containing protein [Verrucomicrobiales bacterium]|nr:3D domain-containing protein [Verrucomicrobiales bacterium]
MKHGRLLLFPLLTAVMFGGVGCVSTNSLNYVERSGISSPPKADRSSAVFRKDRPAASNLPAGTEVFAQATTVSKPIIPKQSVGNGKPVEEAKKEPSLNLICTQSNKTPPSTNMTNMVGSNLLVRTTAYCHKEADSLPYGRMNAAGGQLQYGSTVRSAAADWSRFPLGTRFRIEGQPYEYVIDDYGSALVGTNTIDIYKPTFTAMNEWGVRRVPIHIIKWGCFHKSHDILDGRRHVQGADHVRQMLRDIETRYLGNRYSTAGVGQHVPSPDRV